MGMAGSSAAWLFAGLGLIALGSGGIKPCVSAHVGDQFGQRNSHLLPRVFAAFYFSINVGAAISMALTPWLLEWAWPALGLRRAGRADGAGHARLSGWAATASSMCRPAA